MNALTLKQQSGAFFFSVFAYVSHTRILLEEGKLILQYFASEACVKSATLGYTGCQWSVFESGEPAIKKIER